MKVALFGGTGFIGKVLQQKLAAKGHEVSLFDSRKNTGWESKLSDVDAVVNLAGAPLFGQRWTDEYKSLLHSSRVESTKKIINALEKLQKAGKPHPKTLVNGSAIGYYGPSFDEVVTEETRSGPDFLSFVCREWEEAAIYAQRKLNIRTVLLRTGIVLGKGGGALAQMLPAYKLGLGGPVGAFSLKPPFFQGGQQWFSWIHVDDICGIIVHSLEKDSVQGPLNGTAPNPVRNKDFAHALGSVLHRPSFMPLPSLALWAVVGEAAEILVNGQRVIPQKTEASGYRFQFPELRAALENILQK